MSDYKRVSAGQPWIPSASRENEITDALDYVREQKNAPKPAETTIVDRNTGVVLVKNTTANDVNRGGVLGVSGAVFSPTDNADLFASRPILTGTSPNVSTHQGKFAVLAEPIKAGKLGYAYVDGVFPCKVDVTDTDHSFADVKSNDTSSLQSRAHGPIRLLYKETGTGVKQAIGSLSLTCSPVLFVVTVTQVGGSNGTQSTAASYTYDVKDLLGNTLATAVALARPRPNGAVSAGNGYGLAFYDGNSLKLWDAGEIPGSGHC